RSRHPRNPPRGAVDSLTLYPQRAQRPCSGQARRPSSSSLLHPTSSAMKVPRPIDDQIAQLLALHPGAHLDVIVQMDSPTTPWEALAKAAGEAVSRRRMALTPRELLPRDASHAPGPERKDTSSAANLLADEATKATRTLAAVQRVGRSGLAPLIQSNLVK